MIPQQKLPKTGELPLGQYFLGYAYCSPLGVRDGDVVYSADSREVRFWSLVPGGQGYAIARIPERIKTLRALLRYLESREDCRLKEPSSRLGRSLRSWLERSRS